MKDDIGDSELTEKEVREWRRLARLNQLNIFDDRNKIIALLCERLLTCWERLNKEKKD
jgi:hypothetical protein